MPQETTSPHNLEKTADRCLRRLAGEWKVRRSDEIARFYRHPKAELLEVAYRPMRNLDAVPFVMVSWPQVF